MRKQTKSPLYWLILLVAAAVFTAMAFTAEIWVDEAYTLAMMRHSFAEIWRITAADVHPPLYYFLVKIFGFPFGWHPFSLRIFAALCYLALMAFGGDQLEKLFDRRTALLFMLLFPLYPFAQFYTVQIRMYSFAALAIFCNALYAYRCWKFGGVRDWIGFAVAGICAAYTHYFSLVSAGLIYGVLFLFIVFGNRKLLKPWLISSAVTIAVYLPWLKCFIEQLAFKVSNEYWIEPITFQTVVDYALELLYANGHSLFPVYSGLLVLALVVLAFRRKDWAALLALGVPVMTVVLGLAVSILIRPVFVIRYLAPCAPLLVFFLAHQLAQLKSENIRSGILAVLLVSFSGNLAVTLLDCLPQENRIYGAFQEQTQQAQAYVVLADGSMRIGQVISHHRPEVPVYTTEILGAASPYSNDHPVEDFSAESVDCFVLLTNSDTTPDGFSGFQFTPLGHYQAGYDEMEAWLAERAQ